MDIIVIDIGGTNFRIGVFNKDQEVSDVHRFETPNFINTPSLPIKQLQKLLIDTLVGKIVVYKKKYPHINTIGLSFPAAITKDGITHKVPTVWGQKGENFPLLRHLKKQMPDMKWVIANDISAAAERYGRMEKYKSVDYVCVITVSSGNGNKIYDVKNKKVVLDQMSIGGEIGHVSYDLSPTAPLCDCGGRGHLASYSSGRAIERAAREISKKEKNRFSKSLLKKFCAEPEIITNKHFVKAAKQHDDFALDILDMATLPIAYMMGILSGTVGVGKFIIIGGFALNLGVVYKESLQKNLRKIDFFSRKSEEVNSLVEFGINDDNDCLIGIGLLAQKS